MLKKLLNTPKLDCKINKFIKEKKDIFDILVFGSAVTGKTHVNDIDMAIILRDKKDLNFKLQLSQEFRKQFIFIKYELDVKVVDLEDLQDPSFIAAPAIMAEGFSLTRKKHFHKLFGFQTFVIFSYQLEGLTDSKKKILYYALNGRAGSNGLLTRTDSVSLSNTLIKVPLQHSSEFNEFFQYHKCEYSSWVSVEYDK